MAQRSSFFDSSGGDRIYTADHISRAYQWSNSDGYIVGYQNQLRVSETSPASMAVRVDLGAAWIQGRNFEVYSAAETVSIPSSHPTLPRIDRIVARLNVSARTISLAVVQGTAAPSPVAPALTRTSSTYEISLAQVYVAAATNQVTNGNITDERDNSLVCGKSRHPAGAGATFPGARVYRTSDQSIPNNTITAIQFNAVRFDTGSPVFWSAGQPTRLTVPSAGVYHVWGNAAWNASQAGNDRQWFIWLNGTTLLANGTRRNPSAYKEYREVNTIWKADAGDYLEFCVRQDSGGSLGINAEPSISPEFAIVKCSD